MRTTATPLNQREQVQPNTQKPGLNVVASPVGLGGTGANKVSEIDMMSSGINSFLQGASGYMERKEKDFREASAKQAYDDFNADPNAPPSYSIEQTKEYQDTRLSLFAKRQAYTQSVEMAKQWNELKADPEKLRTTDIRKWTSSFVGEAIQGVDDQVLANTIQTDMQAKADQIMLEGMPILKELDNQARDQDMAVTARSYFKSMTSANKDLSVVTGMFKSMGIPVDKINKTLIAEALIAAKSSIDDKGNPKLGNDTALRTMLDDPNFMATLSTVDANALTSAGELEAAQAHKVLEAQAAKILDAQRARFDYWVADGTATGAIATWDIGAEMRRVYEDPTIDAVEKSRRLTKLLSVHEELSKKKVDAIENVAGMSVSDARREGHSDDKIVDSHLKYWNDVYKSNGGILTTANITSMLHTMGDTPDIFKKVATKLGLIGAVTGTSPVTALGEMNQGYMANITMYNQVTPSQQMALWSDVERSELEYMNGRYKDISKIGDPAKLATSLRQAHNEYYANMNNGTANEAQRYVTSEKFIDRVTEDFKELPDPNILGYNPDFDPKDPAVKAILRQLANMHSLTLAQAESVAPGRGVERFIEIAKKELAAYGGGAFQDHKLIIKANALSDPSVKFTDVMEFANDTVARMYELNNKLPEGSVKPESLIPIYVHSENTQEQGYKFVLKVEGERDVLITHKDGTPLIVYGSKLKSGYNKAMVPDEGKLPYDTNKYPLGPPMDLTGSLKAYDTKKKQSLAEIKATNDKVAEAYKQMTTPFKDITQHLNTNKGMTYAVPTAKGGIGHVLPNGMNKTYMQKAANEGNVDVASAIASEGIRLSVYPDGGGNAIGIGYNIAQNATTAIYDLTAAGVDKATAQRIINGDKTAKITEEQALALYDLVLKGYSYKDETTKPGTVIPKKRVGYMAGVNAKLKEHDIDAGQVPPNVMAALIRAEYNRGPNGSQKPLYVNIAKILKGENVNILEGVPMPKEAKSVNELIKALLTNQNIGPMLSLGNVPY